MTNIVRVVYKYIVSSEIRLNIAEFTIMWRYAYKWT